MRPVIVLSVAFLGLVAVAHLLRLIFSVEIVADGVTFPIWMSGPAVLIAGGLAIWLWYDERKRGRARAERTTEGELL